MSKADCCHTQLRPGLGAGCRKAAGTSILASLALLASSPAAQLATISAAAFAAMAALTPTVATAAERPVTVQPPSRRAGALRAEVTPLVEAGKVSGAVWLEGGDRNSFDVLYAAWNGTSWGTPKVISAGSAGSQLALTTTRLADGAWLLAWSAFNGHDDEIVWSLGRDGAWSAPRPLTNNPTPDILPSLATAGDGALIAWNQLAGDGYRLMVSRFAAGAWSPATAVAAGGALYPAFVTAAETSLRLVYSRVEGTAPAHWEALELDLDGRPLRQAVVPGVATTPETTFTPSPAVLAALANSPLTWTAWSQPAAAPALDLAAGGPAARRQTARRKATGAPPVYIAFGDSITAGYGDTEGIGYPGRLQSLLAAVPNGPATVVNAGFSGETTAGGLARINSVLNQQPAATALLLMEGTNDINARISNSTIIQNLDMIASRAEARGLQVYLATLIPRLPNADYDGTNLVTGTLAGAIRELAWERARGLVDPFEVFWVLTPNALSQDYLAGTDKLHPNDAGYDLLAHTFADVLEGIDAIPPVTGIVSPFPDQLNVPANTDVQIVLYDFGAGIDLANTHLTINGQVVDVAPSGDKTRLSFDYKPSTPFVGVVKIGLQTKDLANPPNSFDGTIAQFIIAGTVFLQGDFNRDGVVDGQDLLALAYAFGAHRYDTRFSVLLDLNGDGIIDGLDLAILAANFGQHSF